MGQADIELTPNLNAQEVASGQPCTGKDLDTEVLQESWQNPATRRQRRLTCPIIPPPAPVGEDYKHDALVL